MGEEEDVALDIEREKDDGLLFYGNDADRL